MADIYSVTSGGTYHFDDPNAWQGGIVPGPNDRALIRYQFTQINDGSGIHYWTGSRSSIQVDSTQYLPDSGSFFTFLRPGSQRIKIDYESKASSYLYNCSIDHTYYDWQPGDAGSNVGYIRNDTYVCGTDFTTIYVSGSATWEVSRIDVEDQGHLILKDQATLRLDSSVRDSFIYVNDGHLTIIDEVTCELTGSARRNSGLITDSGAAYKTILVSGSTDYRAKTTTTSQVPTGSAAIPVNDSSLFAEGDLLSLYTLEDTQMELTITGNNDHAAYQFTETGSVYPLPYRRKILDEDETVQVVSADSNNVYVRRMFGKEGEVIESSNQETRNSFQRKHKKVSKDFEGNKTSVVVRSGHNDFKAGETIVVGTNIYTILEVADKLIPHKTVDFSQGAGLEDFFIDENIGSGSDDSYKVNSHMRSGSFLTLDKAQIGTNSYYRSFYLKNTKLRDAKITLSGSMVDESGSYDGNRMVGLSFGDEVYQRDRVIPFYSRYGYAQENYIGVYGPYFRYGRIGSDYAQMDTRNYEEYTGVDTTQSSFEVTIDRLRENADFYFNGDFVSNFIANYIDSDVGIHLRREGALVNKLVVEEYVQELLLDTSDSISTGTKVYEGGTIIAHPSNQSIVKLASTIKDLRGYNDLFAQRSLGNISGSFVPLFWSNEGNKVYYRNSNSTTEYGRTGGMLKAFPWNTYFRVLSSGNRYFDLNLTEDVTFDAIGIAHTYAGTNAYLREFGVEVSNDGTNWTVIRAQADDPRLGGGASFHRIFRLPETTARFLRIRVNGGSAGSNNYINKLSLYHFNGRGHTLELNNTSDLPVGAKIVLVQPQGYSNWNYNYSRYGGEADKYIAGTIDNDDIVGTMFPTYTITAKTGNVITLDREIEAEYVTPDTLVVRVDRAINVTSGGRFPFGLFYGSTSSNPRNIEFYNVSADSLGSNNRERNYWYSAPDAGRFNIANCYFNRLYYRDSAMYSAGMNWKNNVLINSTTENLYSNLRRSDTNIHGNIVVAYYINLYLLSGISHYVTGNLLIGDRRININGIYRDDSQPRKSVVRNNLLSYKDYMNNNLGQNYDTPVLYVIDFYKNTINSNAGSLRWYKQTTDMFSTKNNVEWPDYYPAVKSNTFYRFGQSGFDKRSSIGAPSGEFQVFYRDPQRGGKSHLIDSYQVGISKRLESNEYDVHSIHLVRSNGIILKNEFNVYTQQQVRVIVEIDYYNDRFIRENDWSRANQIPRLILLDPTRRTITLKELPYQDDYGKFTFDHTFTAEPGNYFVGLTKYHGPYGERIMTFREANCMIKGADPDNLQVITNSFTDYLVLADPEKVKMNHIGTEGLVPFKNNPQRTTVKFRKIKF